MKSFQYERGTLRVLDQLRLPRETCYLPVETVEDTYRVIKQMNVRGAPLIAIVASLGLCVDLHHRIRTFSSVSEMKTYILDKVAYLRGSRPTAVNLFHAMADVETFLKEVKEGLGVEELYGELVERVERMPEKDAEENQSIGRLGAGYIYEKVDKEKINVVHICNTGSLATSYYGTALGIVRALHEDGRLGVCYVLETRPYLQGSRLTAYELEQDGIPAILTMDSAVSSLMASGAIDVCVAGADRVVANGDTANKIGTYQMAISAHYHRIPMLIACPYTSIDLSIASGKDIEIEQRPGKELKGFTKRILGLESVEGVPDVVYLAPEGIDTHNPAFDVTPAPLISAIVTNVKVVERGKSERFYLGVEGEDAVEVKMGRAQGYHHYAPLGSAGAIALCEKVVGKDRLGEVIEAREVGDGNLNDVYIVKGKEGTIVIKQALPYVKVVGPKWSLSLRRNEFEAKALQSFHQYTPDKVPQVYGVDLDLACFAMEYISPPFESMRAAMMAGRVDEAVLVGIADFLAVNHFHTSGLKLSATQMREVRSYWSRNEDLCKLTEQVIFEEPYRNCDNNRYDEGLSEVISGIRADEEILLALMQLRHDFIHHNQALLHGDLHTGSIMVYGEQCKVLDAEFAFYGPIGFDIGLLMGNLFLSYASHIASNSVFADTILPSISALWNRFRKTFLACYEKEGGKGCDLHHDMYASRDIQQRGAELYVSKVWYDSVGYAGCEMIRRIVGIAHVADLDTLEGEKKSKGEILGLRMGSLLLHAFAKKSGLEEVCTEIRKLATQ